MVHMNGSKDGCPRCAKGKLIESVETSERCCQKCGYVVDEVILYEYLSEMIKNDENIIFRENPKYFEHS